MNTESIVLGGGCFWCLDAQYRLIKGVSEVVSGYAGGETPEPTYQEVSSGNTGHTEVVKISFNPSVISLEQLLELFYTIHDPTTPNRQGADVGSQYRSAIYYTSTAQLPVIETVTATMQRSWPDAIVTEIAPLDVFYPAEDYHQDYFNKNPLAGYCQVVINPKLTKLRQKYINLLA